MLHFTAYTCIIIHISGYMSFFTECLDKFTPSSHTGLPCCWYVILLFGDTSQCYIRNLADITELLLCICTQYTAGAKYSLSADMIIHFPTMFVCIVDGMGCFILTSRLQKPMSLMYL